MAADDLVGGTDDPERVERQPAEPEAQGAKDDEAPQNGCCRRHPGILVFPLPEM